MKYLLDTHVLLWSLFDTSKLSKSVKEIILNDQNEIFYENLPDNFDVQGFNHILTFYYK